MKIKYKNLLVTAAILISQQAYSATVTWNDVDYSAGINDVFTLDVVGKNFTGNVDGGGVNILYDSTVLNVLSVSVDDYYWDFLNYDGTIDNTAGSVSSIIVNAFSSNTGDFTVASVEFQAVGAGVTDLALNDFYFNPWAGGGEPISTSYINGSVTVSNVPVPAAAWLFGSSLLALTGFTRKRS